MKHFCVTLIWIDNRRIRSKVFANWRSAQICSQLYTWWSKMSSNKNRLFSSRPITAHWPFNVNKSGRSECHSQLSSSDARERRLECAGSFLSCVTPSLNSVPTACQTNRIKFCDFFKVESWGITYVVWPNAWCLRRIGDVTMHIYSSLKCTNCSKNYVTLFQLYAHIA